MTKKDFEELFGVRQKNIKVLDYPQPWFYYVKVRKPSVIERETCPGCEFESEKRIKKNGGDLFR